MVVLLQYLVMSGGVEMAEELLTVLQAASYLQLSDKTIRRLINNCQLTAFKVGNRSWRIKRSDIEAYLQAHTNGEKGAESE